MEKPIKQEIQQVSMSAYRDVLETAQADKF